MINKLYISKNKLKKNIEIIEKINKNVLFILKDNAYGLGIQSIYPILRELGYTKVGISTFSEAMYIRKIEKKLNLDKSTIYFLNEIEKEDIDKIDEKMIITITRKDGLIDEIIKRKKVFNINLKLDTGMNRLGLSEHSHIDKVLNTNIHIFSVFSHIGNYLDEKNVIEQNKKFKENIKYIKTKIKYRFITHIQASPTLFKYGKKYNYDMARIGMALYGLNPLIDIEKENKLLPIYELKSKIIDIKELKKGQYIAYSDKKIEKNIKVAIIPFGYANGMNKKYSGYILINNIKCKVIYVCMDTILVDITNKNIDINSEVIILNDIITAEYVASLTNTIADDVISKLSYFNIERIVND